MRIFQIIYDCPLNKFATKFPGVFITQKDFAA